MTSYFWINIFFQKSGFINVPYCCKTEISQGIVGLDRLKSLTLNCLSGPSGNVDCPFLAEIELTFSLRIAITSFFKMIIPLKMLLKRNKKKTQNSHLSIDWSMLTPFCIFLDVSTVKNNSTIWQFGDSGSLEQSYWRKLIILKSSIALTPLKTLFYGI